MPYNDDQLFYAALYWTEALPGGKAFTDDICKKYGKPYMPMNAPQQTVRNIDWNNYGGHYEGGEDAIDTLVESGVTQAQCEAFFEAMYACLKKGEEKEESAYSGKFIGLSRLHTSFEPLPFNDSIEHGLQAAGLPREVLNQGTTALFMHDNGHSFFFPADGKLSWGYQHMDYPGRPDTGYSSFPGIKFDSFPEVMDTVSIEHRYRVVDLEVGKTYRSYWMQRDGEQGGLEFTAKEGDRFYITNYDVGGDLELLSQLTDDEITSGTDPRISSGQQIRANDAEQFQPGYIYQSGTLVVATEDPRIVREVQPAMRCMDVTEKMQIKWGRSFQLIEPGDKLLFDEGGRRVMHISKQSIESGECRLVPPVVRQDEAAERQKQLKQVAAKFKQRPV